MKARYSATFEFDVETPLTKKGVVEGTNLSTLYARAARELKREFPKKRWSSVVIVLERQGEE